MSEDTDTECQWHAERRREALEYLDRQRVKHGRLGEAPAWHVYPHLSLWAVESAQSPGWARRTPESKRSISTGGNHIAAPSSRGW